MNAVFTGKLIQLNLLLKVVLYVIAEKCTAHLFIKDLQKNPDLFKVVKNDTQLGILRNFKTTLDRCDGIYVFDIAGDDIIKTVNALQKMINVFKNNDSLG